MLAFKYSKSLQRVNNISLQYGNHTRVVFRKNISGFLESGNIRRVFNDSSFKPQALKPPHGTNLSPQTLKWKFKKKLPH